MDATGLVIYICNYHIRLHADLPDETTAKWAELVESGLADTNKRNTTDLVGGHQLNSSSGSDSDSDFKDIPFPQDDNMQQVHTLLNTSHPFPT